MRGPAAHAPAAWREKRAVMAPFSRPATGAPGPVLADREHAARVADRELGDLRLGDAALEQPGQELALEVGVPVALVVAQLAVVAHVLAEQDPVAVAAVEELEQQVDDPALAVPLLRRERHPEEVELDRGAARDEPEVVVEVGIAVRVPDHDPPGVDALVLEDRELGRPDVGHDGMGRDREAGPPRRPRRRPVDPLLGRRDPRLVRPDLPDDPGPDPGVADAVTDLADELGGGISVQGCLFRGDVVEDGE